MPFGDYDVRITVPADHIVAASGELQNPEEVLNPTQLSRYHKASEPGDQAFIVTPEEARLDALSAEIGIPKHALVVGFVVLSTLLGAGGSMVALRRHLRL